MKNNPKNVSTPVIVILYLLAILFLGYGIYMAYDAVVYVNTYDTNDAVSASNMLQYVVAASASYFGFAIVIFAAASIMASLNKVQKNLYEALSFEYLEDIPPMEVFQEQHIEEQLEEQFEENAAVSSEEKEEDTAVQVSAPVEAFERPEAPETSETPEIPDHREVHDTIEAAKPSVSPDTTESAAEFTPAEDAVLRWETEEKTEEEPQDPAAASDLHQESPVEGSAETIQTASHPLAEEFSSQFLSDSDDAPAPEIVVHQQPTPEIVIQKQSTPEIVVQPRPTADAAAPKPAPEPDASKSTEKLQPPTVPEEILQTKRKRGLKYETVSMDMGRPSLEHAQNLSDTIRLKKEDREALSSSFIKDILEKNE